MLMDGKHTCHDCGVGRGKKHKYGCDMEECPFCHTQVITCDCIYDLLGIDVRPGTKAYSDGATPVQTRKFVKMMELRGRIPYGRETRYRSAKKGTVKRTAAAKTKKKSSSPMSKVKGMR